jgi:apolipoprotein N-acyltransferase
MLIQPNLDVAADDVWVGPDWDRHVETYAKLAGTKCGGFLRGIPGTAGARTDAKCENQVTSLIVSPESPAPFRDVDPHFRSAMVAITQAQKAATIVGDVGMDPDSDTGQYRFYNSASIIDRNGQFVGRYDKIHLVPFGEYVPARTLLFFAHKLTQSLSDTNRGEARKTFRLASTNGEAHRYGVFICYESVFADEIRQFARGGAEVLVNISDDGWYGDTSAPWQHLNMARMRAIENRRWILRDTNNGTTASIDPFGTVRQSIKRHETGVLPAEFGYNSELTFYTLHGDLLPAVCAILSLVVLVWSGRALLGNSASRRPSQIADTP